MRVFMDDADNEFYKKNSIYDNTADLRKDFIILELGRVMVNRDRFHKTLIHDNNSLSTVLPYRILTTYDENKYDVRKGYTPSVEDLIGYTSELRIDTVEGITCIIIKLDENAIININHRLKEDEEFDFTVLGTCNLYPGDVLSGGVDTKYLTSVECIFFNKRKKNEETSI